MSNITGTYQMATPFGNALPSYKTANSFQPQSSLVGNGMLGDFTYNGSNYYLGADGGVYNQGTSDPYGMMFNNGSFFQYAPQNQQSMGSSVGSYQGTLTPDMINWLDPNFASQIQGASAGYNPAPGASPYQQTLINGLSSSQQPPAMMPSVMPGVTPATPPVTGNGGNDLAGAGAQQNWGVTPQAGGASLTYAMDALGTLLNYPTIASQLGLISNLMTPQGYQNAMNPYIEQAMGNIGQSGLADSSYSSRSVANAVQQGYVQNQNNILNALANVNAQMPGLANVYYHPTDAQLEAFLMSYLG